MRARWRNTLMYRATDDFQLGVEYNPGNSSWAPLANYRLVREGPGRPAVIVGTSSDRIGTPFGQAYYVTVGKAVTQDLGVYVGAMYSEFDDRILVPAGASYRFDDRWSALLAYDGVNAHPMVTYAWDRYFVTFLMVGGQDPGVSVGVGF